MSLPTARNMECSTLSSEKRWERKGTEKKTRVSQIFTTEKGKRMNWTYYRVRGNTCDNTVLYLLLVLQLTAGDGLSTADAVTEWLTDWVGGRVNVWSKGEHHERAIISKRINILILIFWWIRLMDVREVNKWMDGFVDMQQNNQWPAVAGWYCSLQQWLSKRPEGDKLTANRDENPTLNRWHSLLWDGTKTSIYFGQNRTERRRLVPKSTKLRVGHSVRVTRI